MSAIELRLSFERKHKMHGLQFKGTPHIIHIQHSLYCAAINLIKYCKILQLS